MKYEKQLRHLRGMVEKGQKNTQPRKKPDDNATGKHGKEIQEQDKTME